MGYGVMALGLGRLSMCGVGVFVEVWFCCCGKY